jgi:hypothetical protein
MNWLVSLPLLVIVLNNLELKHGNSTSELDHLFHFGAKLSINYNLIMIVMNYSNMYEYIIYWCFALLKTIYHLWFFPIGHAGFFSFSLVCFYLYIHVHMACWTIGCSDFLSLYYQLKHLTIFGLNYHSHR